MTDAIRLEPRLTHDAAIRLWGDLKAHRDGTIEVDCSDVRHLSATALQVLLVAHRAGKGLKLVSRSDAFTEKLRLLGGEALFAGDHA